MLDKTLFLLLLTLCSFNVIAAGTIQDVNNLQQDGKLSAMNKQPIFLYVAATDCPYCRRLEKDILKPMLKSGEYQSRLVMRKILWEGTNILKDFNGNEILPESFLLKYNIMATPTILFLDRHGNEIANRITGYRSADLYWYYLDTSVDKAVEVLGTGAR